MRRFALAVLLALIVTSCGGGSSRPSSTAKSTTPNGSGSDQATTSTSGANTPTTAARQRTRVGAIDSVVPKGGLVDGAFAVSNAALREQSMLVTDPQGVIDFHLDKKLRACRAKEGSTAEVAPSSDVLIAFKLGVFLCGTTASGPLATFNGGASRLSTNDPVFVVRAGGDGTLQLEVVSGFIGIAGGSGMTVVGPSQAAAVTADHVSTLRTWGVGELGADDQAYVGRLLGSAPEGPQYPAPSLADSPTLSRALARGRLNVAVTESAGARQVGDFAQRLLQQIVGAWNLPQPLEIAATITTPEKAQTLLASGEVDLVVSATPSSANAIPVAQDAIPLVQDDDAQVWFATLDPTDDQLRLVLSAAIATSLGATCPTPNQPAQTAAPGPSCYDSQRDGLFTTEPTPLAPFAGLLGLGQ